MISPIFSAWRWGASALLATLFTLTILAGFSHFWASKTPVKEPLPPIQLVAMPIQSKVVAAKASVQPQAVKLKPNPSPKTKALVKSSAVVPLKVAAQIPKSIVAKVPTRTAPVNQIQSSAEPTPSAQTNNPQSKVTPQQWLPLSRVEPEYPAAARRRGVEGAVRLELVVNAQGEVIEIERIISEHPLLTRAATQAVRQWRYPPNKPQKIWVMVLFRLTP